jgi:predicted enzyme related to lactoylglutathione lyase
MRAKLVQITVPTRNLPQSQAFYAGLFGMKLARSFTDELESYHIPISGDGVFLAIAPPQHQRDNAMCCFFAVDKLEAAVAELESAGGKSLGSPVKIDVAPRARDYYAGRLQEHGVKAHFDGSFIRIGYMEDPDGNLLGLMEIDPASHYYFGMDRLGQPLTTEQVSNHERTIRAGDRFAAGEKP